MHLDFNTWYGFWVSFRLPIFMSLVGALIGHYRANGMIIMPTIVISYQKGSYYKNAKGLSRIFRVLFILADFLVFLIGFRFHRNVGKDGIYFELGFLGELLVGVATGILAKATVMLAHIPSDTSQIATISGSLLAGFTGMSYIQRMQGTNMTEEMNKRKDFLKVIENQHFEEELTGKSEIQQGLEQVAPEKRVD